MSLVAAGLICVDDGFTRRYLSCDLRGDAGCVVDPSAVGPSDIGLRRWRTLTDLEISLGPLSPGDAVKLKLCSPGGAQGVVLAVDDAPVADLAVGTTWLEHEVVTPVGGHRIRLRRRDPAGPGIDISRLSLANTVGYASGLVELAVRSRLARPIARRVDPLSRVTVLALPPVLVALLLALDRRRGRSWPMACEHTVATLLPPAVLLALAAGLTLVSSRVVTFPGRTYPALVLLPAAITVVVRDRTTIAAWLRHAAAQWLWPRLRALAAEGLRPDGWTTTTARAAAAVALTLFALAAVMLLPRSPFEWDEVLFLRAMDRFDVAEHSPHPPGYPLYIAAAHAVNAIMANPALSLQLVSVIGVVLTLLGLGLALRRLGAPRGAVAIAGVLLAFAPAFAFHANVGLSDALATGLATLTLGTCATTLTARPQSWWLVPTAGLAALALGTRPQVGALLIGPGLWLIGHAVRSRSWRALAAATVTGIVVSAACWVPVVALTGWSRYLAALGYYRRWIARNEVGGHLPGAPLGRLLDAWLVQPFGSAALALPFWILVVAGGVAWWRSGQRRVPVLAVLGAGGYLTAAFFKLQLDASVRYVLPALPCLAMLAGGVVTIRPRVVRGGLAAAAAALAFLEAGWGAPVYLLRAREVAPTWGTLEWVRAHVDPATTQVVFATVIRPHAELLLPGHGVVSLEANQPGVPDLPGPEVWLVGPLGWMRGERLIHREEWHSDRLRRLTRNRYFDCGVAQRGGPSPALLGEPLPQGPWRLTSSRTLRLAPDQRRCSVRVAPSQGIVEARRGELPVVRVTAGPVAELPVASEEAGALQLLPVGPDVTLTAQLLPPEMAVEGEPRWIVPSVAHAVGPGGESWTSDLELVNGSEHPVTCRLSLLPTDSDAGTPRAVLPILPGETLRLPDVVRLLFAATGSGAVAIATDRAEVRVRSTMHRSTPGGERESVDIPPVAPADALGPFYGGEATVVASGHPPGSRVNLGVVNLSDLPAVVAVRLIPDDRVTAEARRVLVGPWSYRVVGLGSVTRVGRLEVAVESEAARVLAHASIIDERSARWQFLPVARVPLDR